MFTAPFCNFFLYALTCVFMHTRHNTHIHRTIIVLTQTLQPLPDDVMMTMKLCYYDDGMLNRGRENRVVEWVTIGKGQWSRLNFVVLSFIQWFYTSTVSHTLLCRNAYAILMYQKPLIMYNWLESECVDSLTLTLEQFFALLCLFECIELSVRSVDLFSSTQLFYVIVTFEQW